METFIRSRSGGIELCGEACLPHFGGYFIPDFGKRPETFIQLPQPTTLARLPLLRFASNAGKAIGDYAQEFSHHIKPVQIKKS